MGYYTDFKIQTEHDKGPEYLSGIEIYGCNFENTYDNVYEMIFQAKWYTYKEDMISMSEKFPELVFIVDGDGEESGDFWRAFYKEGLSYLWSPDIAEMRKQQKFDQLKIDAIKMEDALI